MRWLWAAAGIICVALAAIGILLPLLPTVPFLLLAAFCFARSSERLHARLLQHPTLGPPILDWQELGAIRKGAKRLSTASIALVFAISVFLGLNVTILAIQAIVLGAVLVFIWTRPGA